MTWFDLYNFTNATVINDGGDDSDDGGDDGGSSE